MRALQLQALLLLLLPLTSSTLTCHPESPIFPSPSTLSSSPLFLSAASNLTSTLNAALSGAITAGWPVQNTSFSLALVSSSSPVPVWEYHHLAEGNVRGTKLLNRDSQYLIGSISKVLTDYVLLKSGVDLDAGVTELVPELARGERIAWGDVTLRMLASQLSGAPTNYGFSEYYYLKDVFLAYGFPPVPDSDYPPCGVIALNGACSQQDFLNGMIQSYPVTAPMERPSYSNIAFTILVMALENVTGKNYTQLVDEIISKPLGMHSTFPSPGNDDKAVIPPGESSWGGDYGYNAPGGGLVSTISDLSKFTHNLLSRTLNLTAAQTRQWLKPVTFAGGPSSAVGMPWEIFRPLNLVPDHPCTVTIFGKGGGAQGYRSQLSVLDEYGIGLVVLTAGDMLAQPFLTDALLTTFVPVVDEVARAEAEEDYSRTFKSGCDTAKEDRIDVTFAQDTDSMIISSFNRMYSDILSSITQIWNLTMGQYAAPVSPKVRLFPTELKQETTTQDGKLLTKEVWRLWPEFTSSGHSNLPGAGLEETNCMAWTTGDWVHYGSEPMDRVLFYRAGGKVVGFEAPFLRSGVLRAV